MSNKPSKPLEEIVREVGRYPLDAFIFIQECIGAAAEIVHGPMSPDQLAVAQWMAREDVGPDELAAQALAEELPEKIARAIEKSGGVERMNRHVSGPQLCWAIRDVALARWGLMARSVLARWNITRTEDIGLIIFALVDNCWLQKQPTDTIEDFNRVFTFDDVFDPHYKIGGEVIGGK